VNLPARRVVISNISRYDARSGANRPISVLEYKQLCGRAGRPQYDDHGESVVVVGSFHAPDIVDYYVNGEPEPIESRITDDKSLRIHVLSIIVTDPGLRQGDVLEFFLQTLGGHQSRKPSLRFAVNIALRFLVTEGMLIKKGDRYAATDFGKKTSRLYIDPMTAARFRRSLEGISGGGTHTLGLLHLVSGCDEFFPKFGLRGKDYEKASMLIESRSPELIGQISEYDCNRSLLALDSWISESSELSLSDNLGIESGDMHRMVETGDRLLYCLREIAKGIDRADLLEELDVLRARVTYGIRQDLADLVRVRGIGRVRARALHRHGVTDVAGLRRIPVSRLAGIDKIGSALAKNIKSQLRRVR